MDANRPQAADPGLDVAQGHIDVVVQASAGDRVGGSGQVEQLLGRGVSRIASGLVDLVGTITQHAVEDLGARGHEPGMGHPRAVKSLACLALFVFEHLRERTVVDGFVRPARDERRHAAHCVRSPAVTGGD